MPNPTDEIREEIRQLNLRHARGDLREKVFQRALAQRTTDLYRALVEGSLLPGERILQEHHVIQAHMRLTQSLLREPEQIATSLFLTQRRILRVRSRIIPGQPPTGDHRDSTVLDELPLTRLKGLKKRRQVRPGEALVGIGMALVALAFWEWLEVTGIVLLGLGLCGAIHGLLIPTTWIELVETKTTGEPFKVMVPRKKSAKELLRSLEGCVAKPVIASRRRART